MQQYEINVLLNNIYLKNKDSWEQTRMLGYITAQVNSSKKLNIEDIISFPWDNKNVTAHDTTISNEDIERLRKRANNYLKKKQ